MTTRQLISLRNARAIYLNTESESQEHNLVAASFNAELMRYGFTLSQKGMQIVSSVDDETIAILHQSVLPRVAGLVGADVQYTPMYPNFPEQVMEASMLELYMNAILHYWSFGTWKPQYERLAREIGFEKTQFKTLEVIGESDFLQIFQEIVSSNDSISDADKFAVRFFLDEYGVEGLEIPEMPFKENMCFVASELLELGHDISGVPKTATDVLRIATALSGGDVSLATNVKFKSLPRAQRRMFVAALYRCANLDDFMRHRSKWVRLFHMMHINELTDSVSLTQMVQKVRSGQRAVTFNSTLEGLLSSGDVPAAVNMLVERPGDFARRLDHVLRLARSGRMGIVANFLEVANKVSTRVLMQLLGHMKTRGNSETEKRVVFPKGNTQRAQVVRQPLEKLGPRVVRELIRGVEQELVDRFAAFGPLGSVFVDKALKECPLPAQQRSASEGLIQVARGTRMPIRGDANTLRFFIYWVGQDIDLSATLHDESFGYMEHISYTNLKSTQYQACHSGDITYAPGPKGASEFIDITMDDAVKAGARYVVMNVFVYSGPNFADHEKCYAGWMTREKPNSNEIYDPKTVEQKIDLTVQSRNAIPVVFDLVERKAIWTDLATGRSTNWGGNNVESNSASIQEVVEAVVSLDNKPTLFDLFDLHAEARGTEVDFVCRDGADTVFSIEGGIGPQDIGRINAEFMADSPPQKVQEKA